MLRLVLCLHLHAVEGIFIPEIVEASPVTLAYSLHYMQLLLLLSFEFGILSVEILELLQLIHVFFVETSFTARHSKPVLFPYRERPSMSITQYNSDFVDVHNFTFVF